MGGTERRPITSFNTNIANKRVAQPQLRITIPSPQRSKGIEVAERAPVLPRSQHPTSFARRRSTVSSQGRRNAAYNHLKKDDGSWNPSPS